MSGIQFILIAMCVIGFLPLVVIVYKSRLAKRIIATGLSTQASVYFKQRIHRDRAELVYYSFYASFRAKPYTGTLTTKVGQYRIGDVLTVYYLAQHPQRNTVAGAWKSTGMIVFGIAIAAFVLFAAYKINETLMGRSL